MTVYVLLSAGFATWWTVVAVLSLGLDGWVVIVLILSPRVAGGQGRILHLRGRFAVAPTNPAVVRTGPGAMSTGVAGVDAGGVKARTAIAAMQARRFLPWGGKVVKGPRQPSAPGGRGKKWGVG